MLRSANTRSQSRSGLCSSLLSVGDYRDDRVCSMRKMQGRARHLVGDAARRNSRNQGPMRGGGLLRSANTRSQSRSGLCSSLFASSMILLATIATTGFARSVRCKASHVISNATPMMRLISGSTCSPFKYGVMGMLRYTAYGGYFHRQVLRAKRKFAVTRKQQSALKSSGRARIHNRLNDSDIIVAPVATIPGLPHHALDPGRTPNTRPGFPLAPLSRHADDVPGSITECCPTRIGHQANPRSTYRAPMVVAALR